MSILGNPVCLPIGGKAAKGSRMFLGVTLPRSIYYEQAAEWLKIKDNPRNAVAENQWDGQVVCGGNLWELYGNNAYCYSLENGDLLETVPLSGINGTPCCGITTDGKSRIWICRILTSTGVRQDSGAVVASYVYGDTTIFLFEFDIESKSLKNLYSLSRGRHERNCGKFYSWSKNGESFVRNIIGIIGYSKQSNKVYFGKYHYSINLTIKYSTSSSGAPLSRTENLSQNENIMFAYDLTTNTCTQIAAHPYNDTYMGQYFYDDGDFFYVGNGFSGADKDKRISRYNKLSNIWENLSTTFEGYTVGPFSYVQIGDKMLQISKDATGIFDPKTGNLETLSTPVVPPDATVMYPGFKAFSNNILYLVTNQGVYKCPFFSKVPEDAPIVAKIYKGQKYHTLEPFEIPGKLKLLRTQQIADKDYEIKMYEYSSEGGQTIYIEDVGE